MRRTLANVTRRPLYTRPGEGVFLCLDIGEYSERFAKFLDESHINADDVVISPLVGFPIPVPKRDPLGNLLRWEGVNPAMLWHPLFWLPKSVISKIVILSPAGEERVESADEFAMRVAAQCLYAGLFDVESGNWVDVLDLYGLDVNDPAVQERLTAWTAGGEDAELSAIDLTDLFTDAKADIHSENVSATLAGVPFFVRAQWALTADQAIRSVHDAREEGATGELALDYAQMFASCTYVGLAGGELIGDTTTRDQVQQIFEELHGDYPDAEAALDRLLEIATVVQREHRPALDVLFDQAE